MVERCHLFESSAVCDITVTECTQGDACDSVRGVTLSPVLKVV